MRLLEMEGVMGWAARRRGNYEQRKASAIIRDHKIIKARKIEGAKRVAAMTPKERARRRGTLRMFTMMSMWNANRVC